MPDEYDAPTAPIMTWLRRRPTERRDPNFRWVVWALGFIAVAALQLACGRAVLKPYDEGLVLYGAGRVASGGVPYRDFWSMYGPGSFYALGGLDKMFGESVLTGRIFDAAARAGVAILVFALVARWRGRVLAAGCALVCFLLLAFGVREYLFPALPATVTALLALYALQVVLGGVRPPLAWAFPGAAVGATLLFRPDFGAYAACACLWAALAPRATDRDPPRRLAASMAAFVGGILVVAGPLYLWLLVHASSADLFDDLLRIPMRVYVANRSLPFPSPLAAANALFIQHAFRPVFTLMVYLPWLVALSGVGLAISRRMRGANIGSTDRDGGLLFEATLVLLVLLCVKGSVRVDSVQMLPALVVALVAAALASAQAARPSLTASRNALVVISLVAAFTAVGGLAHARKRALKSEPAPFFLMAALDCDTAAPSRLGCFLLDPDRSAVLNYLVEHARTGDTLYVGTGRHDKLISNNVELYFLSGLPAATKWADLHPGVQTTVAIQREMIAEMTRHPPAYVVRNTEWDLVEEPNASRDPSGVTLLDDYLQAGYVPVLQAGRLSISVARHGAAP